MLISRPRLRLPTQETPLSIILPRNTLAGGTHVFNSIDAGNVDYDIDHVATELV